VTRIPSSLIDQKLFEQQMTTDSLLHVWSQKQAVRPRMD
jgi:hypothetical protein